MVCTELLDMIALAIMTERKVSIKNSYDWDTIVNYARKHGVLQMLYLSIEHLPKSAWPDSNMINHIKQAYYRSIHRSIKQLYEAKQIQDKLEASRVCNLALKGINTKRIYPDPCLRLMSDLDILIKPEQNKQCHKAMVEIGYDGFEEGRKHDHYYTQGRSCVEIHRQMLNSYYSYEKYYCNFFDKCSLKKGKKYIYEMSYEDEYIFNIVHLVEHFKLFSINAKFIVDVYIYNHARKYDRKYVENEFIKLNLLSFARNIEKLSELWFGNGQSTDDVTNKIAEYVFLYGEKELENNTAFLQTAKGKNKYLLHSIFPSYRDMVSMFPWLHYYPFLLPIAWIIRGIKSILYRRNNIKTVIDRYKKADSQESIKLRKFYKECGLDL